MPTYSVLHFIFIFTAALLYKNHLYFPHKEKETQRNRETEEPTYCNIGKQLLGSESGTATTRAPILAQGWSVVEDGLTQWSRPHTLELDHLGLIPGSTAYHLVTPSKSLNLSVLQFLHLCSRDVSMSLMGYV